MPFSKSSLSGTISEIGRFGSTDLSRCRTCREPHRTRFAPAANRAVRRFHLSLLAVVHAHAQIVQRTKSEIIIRFGDTLQTQGGALWRQQPKFLLSFIFGPLMSPMQSTLMGRLNNDLWVNTIIPLGSTPFSSGSRRTQKIGISGSGLSCVFR